MYTAYSNMVIDSNIIVALFVHLSLKVPSQIASGLFCFFKPCDTLVPEEKKKYFSHYPW